MSTCAVTDYGEENPLLMDYYGFDQWLYEIKFKSTGSSALSSRIVEALRKSSLKARTSPKLEPRGHDGRGFAGPGLDHGVFVPFKYMFGDAFTDIPIVQVSINESLDPDDNWRLGKAVEALR
jgi:aromatic ring-opening dioxygenase catalytic subunit (LigB family)